MWKSRQTICYGDIIKLRSPICVKHDVVDIFTSEEKYEGAKSVEAFLRRYKHCKNLYFICLPCLFESKQLGSPIKEKEVFRAVSTDGTVIYLFPFQSYEPDNVEEHIFDSLLKIRQKQYIYESSYIGGIVEQFRPICNFSTSATTISVSNYSTTTTGWSTDYNIRWV